MTPVDLVLSRLDEPREVAPGRWRARCPAHGGKNRTTLAVTDGDDGRVLLHCFSDCDTEAVVHAIGLTLADLFPDRPGSPGGVLGPRGTRSCRRKCLKRCASNARWCS